MFSWKPHYCWHVSILPLIKSAFQKLLVSLLRTSTHFFLVGLVKAVQTHRCSLTWDGATIWSTITNLKHQGSNVHLICSPLNSAGDIPAWELWPVAATAAQHRNSSLLPITHAGKEQNSKHGFWWMVPPSYHHEGKKLVNHLTSDYSL